VSEVFRSGSMGVRRSAVADELDVMAVPSRTCVA
jgi:hypothetical protein